MVPKFKDHTILPTICPQLATNTENRRRENGHVHDPANEQEEFENGHKRTVI